MKYFIDFEFIEGFHKPFFGKKRHFIDLISVGVFAEDRRTYYAISNEFKASDANDWVKENVISKLPKRFVNFSDPSISPTQKFAAGLWKSNKRIVEELMMFFYPEQSKQFKGSEAEFLSRGKQYGWAGDQPEFYGYFADYDWVLFCSLFGKMINLPKGFPMYCIDLKQTLDEVASKGRFPQSHPPTDLKDSLSMLKQHRNYPKQENEHNALADAKWNYDLYKFIQTL